MRNALEKNRTGKEFCGGVVREDITEVISEQVLEEREALSQWLPEGRGVEAQMIAVQSPQSRGVFGHLRNTKARGE